MKRQLPILLALLGSCRASPKLQPKPTSKPAPESAIASAPTSVKVSRPLRLARITLPHSLDPQRLLSSAIEDERIAGALFEPLTRCDPETLAPKANLATSWERSDDGKTWRFHLQKNLAFSNGEPLTSEDVLFSWQRLLDPLSPGRFFFLLDPVENARSFRNGQRVKATETLSLEGGEISANEPLFAILADVSEISRDAALLDAPKGKVISALSPGDIVSLIDEPKEVNESDSLYQVKVLASSGVLSGATLNGFVKKEALRPLYGPTTRALSIASTRTYAAPEADAPLLDALDAGQVVAPLPGEFARKVGELRLLQVRDVEGQLLGWADAESLKISSFGATKVFVRSLDGTKRGWASTQKITTDFSQVGLSAPDDSTIELRLSQPAGYLPALLCRVQLAPVPKDLIEREGASWTEKMAGSGPFIVDSSLPNGGVKLVANPRWFKGAPRSSEVSIYRYQQEASGDNTLRPYDQAVQGAIEHYLSGDIDALFLGAWDADPTKYAALFGRADFKAIDSWQDYHIRVNTSRGALAEKEVRQAINAALDRASLRVSAAATPELYRSLTPSLSFTPAFPGYHATEPLISEEEAKRLWKEIPASKRPKKLEMLSPNWSLTQMISEDLKRQLKDTLGIELTVTYLTWAEIAQRNEAKDFDLIMVSWLGDYADPATFVEMLSEGSLENTTQWKSEAFTKKVAEAEGEPDATKRLSLLGEAEAVLLEEAPLIPLFVESQYVWTSEKLEGLSVNPLLLFDWSQLGTKE